MASAVDLAKRALVSLLRALAIVYGISVEVTRDSDDAAVRRAFKIVCRKAHPDKGGSADDQKKLNATHDAWNDATRARAPKGRPSKATKSTTEPASAPMAATSESKAGRRAFRIDSSAVLFTYQGFTDGWSRFLAWVASEQEGAFSCALRQ